MDSDGTAPERYFEAFMDGIEGVRLALREGRIKPSDLGMVLSSPFDKEGHGSGCWFRSGGPCDCTAKTTRYWTVPK